MSVRDVIQAAAGSATGDSKTYIEDVFSTYLYTGNGSTQTINNGIDLAGKGGMVWIKSRNVAASSNALFDTARGANKYIKTDSIATEVTSDRMLMSFNSNGFTLGTDNQAQIVNYSGNLVSWTFRKAPKFFDVVTYTGTGGMYDRAIPHNLGTTPGMYIVKRLNSTSDWWVWHRTQAVGTNGTLNTTAAFGSAKALQWDGIVPVNESQFCVTSGGLNNTSNISGATYVAYLFAHDTSTDGLIQCGSFTTDASGNATVNLGWEPQYMMVKCSSTTGDWYVADVMRGASNTRYALLNPNLSAAETTGTGSALTPNATGFTSAGLGASRTFIYMAIRRGPMRTPTDGTKVFQTVVRTGSGVASVVNTTITPDTFIHKNRGLAGTSVLWLDRLRDNYLVYSESTSAEGTSTGFPAQLWDNQTGYDIASTSTGVNNTTYNYIDWVFKRAPGFFDVVCYTGTMQTPTTVSHNLKVAPELIIIKNRYYGDSFSNWFVYAAPLGANKLLYLNKVDAAVTDNTAWYNTTPIATEFKVDNWTALIHEKAVAYLFASCPGVSKVGSYTGSALARNIDCGFSAGARFVMIKRTDSAGDWYVFDTARGITSSLDPYLLMNSTGAEVTNTSYVTAYAPGFTVMTATPINVSGGSYIYLAIA